MCFNCKNWDLNCFIDRLIERAKSFANNKLPPKTWTYEDIHFFPQNW